MENFEQLVKERRSASNFLENHPISTKELDEIFELVKLAPSAFNLQHTNYLVVLNPELKEEVKKAAYGQHKVSTASAVIVVLGDKKAYREAARIYEGLLLLGVLNKQEFDQMVQDTVSFYESRGEAFQRDESIRNASLSAMLFMMAAKSKGWDTCPMIGFDPEHLKQVLNISDQYEPVLMITLGKEKVQSRKPRGYRKPVAEFVTYL
ncbi:nitroreductase family protein [Thermaerobacillus caldiproteolyticus]|uniref:nitroreductase family protein n=1 Tax=Thermaerobacillus caldiproteolyticus TaxID=247480 RepID=UPI001889F63C|nr:nitroreductase family protein [Anoxybacillus caldiproteolyticus]QPA31123.1 nitroreductase family protein [Anoxybacillus caldiproteolyticus]